MSRVIENIDNKKRLSEKQLDEFVMKFFLKPNNEITAKSLKEFCEDHEVDLFICPTTNTIRYFDGEVVL